MTLPPILQNLRIPAVGAPLFLISNPDTVIAQCTSGIIGTFPALNAREDEGEPIELDLWIVRINEELDRYNQANSQRPAASYAVNLNVHRTNPRLERDLEICVRHEVPIIITSLGAREEVNVAVHSYGGITLHDVINIRYAHKAIEKGADGLIAVAAGAGGHTGSLSPFALVQEIREWFDGPLLLAGCIARGDAILAAEAMGVDLAYIGSAFIATEEATAATAYKEMIAECSADDIVCSNYFTGVHGNYLKPTIQAHGLDPDRLEVSDSSKMNFAAGTSRPKKWKDIWGAGHGIGAVTGVVPVAELIDRLEREYLTARKRMKFS